MKTFYRITLGLLALALLASPLLAPQVQAQSIYDGMANAEIVGGALTAVSTEVPIVVRYIGNTVGGGVSGKVAVDASTGDITFTSGAYGSEAADTTLECPVSGALGGVIDVSNSACDTLGEVVDIINASTNWRAVILDGLRSDSSDNTLITLSATNANAIAGLGLLHDSTVSFKSTIAMVTGRNISDYMTPSGVLNPNPFARQRAVFLLGNETTTFGSGTSTYQIFSCLESYATTGGSETCTTLYAAPAGDTTVNAAFNYLPYGITAKKGEKLIARVLNSAAMSAAVHYAYGRSWFYPPQSAGNN